MCDCDESPHRQTEPHHAQEHGGRRPLPVRCGTVQSKHNQPMGMEGMAVVSAASLITGLPYSRTIADRPRPLRAGCTMFSFRNTKNQTYLLIFDFAGCKHDPAGKQGDTSGCACPSRESEWT